MQESMTDTDKETIDEEEEELVKKIRNDIRKSRDHLLDWRMDAEENYDFFSGKQWSHDDAQKLLQQNRPSIVFNRIARTINAVAGLELQNRQEVRYTPRTKDDAYACEVLSAAAKWERDNTDAEDEESEAFQDTLICGMGWTETRLDYEIDPDGVTRIDRIDPLQMYHDPSATKRNNVDDRWRARDKKYSKDEFKELWPDFDPVEGSTWPDFDNRDHDATDAYKYENNNADTVNKKNTISVIQYQWWEREDFYRVAFNDPNTQQPKMVSVDISRFNEMKGEIEKNGLKYVKQKRRVYKQAFINGPNVLDQGPAPCDGFSFNCITGLRDRNSNTWFGIVSLMKDPQRWANKWLSQILHIINSNAKGGILAETGAFKNPRDIADEWAKPDPIIELNPGGLAKIQQREAPRYPEGLDRLLQYAMQNISDIPGVNLEMLGVANRDQAGYLEQQRKEAGVTILASFFDALRRYRKEQGRLLAHFVIDYLSDGRLVKIVGSDQAQYVPLLKENFDIDYDVIIDDAPTSPNMKEKVFRIISSLLPILLQANIPIPPDILDYAPLPEGLTEKWKEMISANTNDPIQQQMKQINLMLAQLKIQSEVEGQKESESRTYLNYAKSVQAQGTGQEQQALAEQKAGLLQSNHESGLQQAMQDSARRDVEMVLNQRRKDLELQLEANRNSQKDALDAHSTHFRNATDRASKLQKISEI